MKHENGRGLSQARAAQGRDESFGLLHRDACIFFAGNDKNGRPIVTWLTAKFDELFTEAARFTPFDK